jgi:CRISPR-associated exonuclease Cas4
MWPFGRSENLKFRIPDKELDRITAVITSSVYLAFSVCPTQGWLMAHRIVPDQDNPYIERGRGIDRLTFGRARRQIPLGFSKIDILDISGRPTVVEVKASEKSVKSGLAQIEYLLYLLWRKKGIVADGELRIPTARRRYRVRLTQRLVDRVEENLMKYWEMVEKPMPQPRWKPICRACGYRDLCHLGGEEVG